MARPATINPADVAACQAEGLTQRETAARLGVSLSSVYAHWTRQPTRGYTRGSRHAEQIAAMVAEGKTDREIAEALGVVVSTVNRQRRKLQE